MWLDRTVHVILFSNGFFYAEHGFGDSSLLLPLFSLQPLCCCYILLLRKHYACVWVVTTSIIQFVWVPSLSMCELLLGITEAAYKRCELSKSSHPRGLMRVQTVFWNVCSGRLML